MMATKPQTDPTITPTLLPLDVSSLLGVSEAEADGVVDDMEVLAVEEVSELVEGAIDDGVGEADDVAGGLDEEDGLIEEDEGITAELEDGTGAELEEAGTEEVADAEGAFVDDAPGAAVVDVHVLNTSHRNWA